MTLLLAAAGSAAPPVDPPVDPWTGQTLRTTVVSPDAMLSVFNAYPWGPGTWKDAHYRTRITLTKPCRNLRISRQNWRLGGTPGLNPYQWGCDMETLDGTVTQWLFGGQSLATIQPGAWVLSDPLPGTHTAQTQVYVRPYFSVPTKADEWQHNPGPSLTPTTGNDSSYYRQGGRVTGAWPFTTPYWGSDQVPTIIIGETPDLSDTWVGIGDSLMTRDGWTARAYKAAGITCLIRGIGSRSMGHLSGEFDYWFQDGALGYVDHAVLAMGRNDGGDPRSTLPTVLTKLRAAGMHGQIVLTTITPYTTSTDNWATIGGQAHAVSDAPRVAYNTWIRDGAPWSTTTNAPATTGATGTNITRLTQPGHPCTGTVAGPKPGALTNPHAQGYLEVADTCETARNSGMWRVDGGAWCDGIHPTTYGATRMAAALNLGIAT